MATTVTIPPESIASLANQGIREASGTVDINGVAATTIVTGLATVLDVNGSVNTNTGTTPATSVSYKKSGTPGSIIVTPAGHTGTSTFNWKARGYDRKA